MNQRTIATLNAINRDFYDEVADDFSATRRKPWQGWTPLLDFIDTETSKLTVLDVGCGNGRFARFLKDHISNRFDYIGVDVSRPSLEIARNHLSDLEAAQWIQHDIVSAVSGTYLPSEIHRRFSLIVAFGLYHHVPGYEERLGLLNELARRLEHQGILAISFWQFARFERFKKKMVPWSDFQNATGVSVDPSDLEPGDTILTWGGPPPAHRYCHFLDPEEISRMLGSQPLEIVADYHADGATGDLNHYYLLEKRG